MDGIYRVKALIPLHISYKFYLKAICIIEKQTVQDGGKERKERERILRWSSEDEINCFRFVAMHLSILAKTVQFRNSFSAEKSSLQTKFGSSNLASNITINQSLAPIMIRFDNPPKTFGQQLESTIRSYVPLFVHLVSSPEGLAAACNSSTFYNPILF